MANAKTFVDPTTSCRQCPIRCDKVVYLSGCFESQCPKLYAYVRDERTYVGCVDRVIGVEVDVEAFRELQRTREGFGGLRAAREPHGYCRSDVDTAFPHRATQGCRNPLFLISTSTRPLRIEEESD